MMNLLSPKKKKKKLEENIELTAELIARVKRDPVAFARIFCKFYPHWYQVKILRDMSKNIAIRMGRQMGKTAATAIKALWYAFTRPEASTPQEQVTIVIIAPSQRQSKIMYNQIRSYIHANPILEASVIKSTQQTIKLDNNSVIYNFPVGDSAEKVRGFSINLLIVDEAAFIKQRIFTAILPSLAGTNGSLILIGTPASRTGLFYQAFYPGKDGSGVKLRFSTHWYPYSDALDVQRVDKNGVPLFDKDGNPITQLSRDWIEYQYTSMSKGEFAQEFEAKFVDESLGYFTREDLIANVEDYSMEHVHDGESVYAMGVDFAKYHDSYVALVIKRDINGITRVVYTLEARNRNYSETVPLTIKIAKRFRCRYVFCDSTGVGEPNAEIIEKELKGISIVKSVNMSSLQKQIDMYSNLQRMFGEGVLKIPASNRELISQLSLVMRTITPSGRVKIEAAEGQHDDFCFDGSTKVQTTNGYIDISKIKKGDIVLTSSGHKKVINTSEREINELVYRVKVKGRPTFTCTKNHPFKTVDGDFDIIDNLQYLRKDFIKLNERRFIDLAEIQYDEGKHGSSKIIVNEDTISYMNGRLTTLPRYIQLDYDFGFIIGAYLAEGSIGAHDIQFTLNKTDDPLIEIIKEKFKNVFGCELSYIEHDNNSCNLYKSSLILRKLFKTLIPGISSSKRIHPLLFSNKDFLRGLIEAYYKGDGCIINNGRGFSVSTNSLNLAYQITDILNLFGIYGNIHTSHRKGKSMNLHEHKYTHNHNLHQIRISGSWYVNKFIDLFWNEYEHISDNKFHYCKEKWYDDFVLIPFKKNEIEYIGSVYNLYIDDVNEFSIGSATVHNCDALALACMMTVNNPNPPKTLATSVKSVFSKKTHRHTATTPQRRRQQTPYRQVAVFDERGRIIGTRTEQR
ncbi:MAG: hypothetical protein GF411_03000 [Candidatus Lokiarchaeota archaeon]|nr:hypothetical protein [Candidatus Lokiarchaeota archaeon]